MKDIRPALRVLMLDSTSVSSLVGAQRIYPVRLPQGEKAPSVVYNRITEVPDYHLLGPSGLVQSTFQIDSWALTQSLAVLLANAVYDRLSGFRGYIDLGIAEPVTVHGIFGVHGHEDYDPGAELFRMRRDYRVHYWER